MARAEARTPPPPRKTWVRQIREASGLTQEDFAARVGALRETVAKWEDPTESGSEPGFKYVLKIINTFPTEAAPTVGLHAVGPGATSPHASSGGGHVPSELAQTIAVLVDRLENEQQKLELLYEVRKFVQARVSSSRPPSAT